MKSNDYLSPNINEGRIFISPVLGCSGACSYCYLPIKDYYKPKKNACTVLDCFSIANQSSDFIWGREGTIISVGAWGDIFPENNTDLTEYSVQTIKSLLEWGNPVQIMSKFSLQEEFVNEIVNAIRYPGQLLYSTTITSIKNWRSVEPGTSSPIDRLITCSRFHKHGVPTNVLIKPFIPKLTGVEIETITDCLLDYHIDYCVLGIMYLNEKVLERIRKNTFLLNNIDSNSFTAMSHLDCNGTISIEATEILDLLPYICFLRSKGISAFLKSSCVNSNVLCTVNPSNYYTGGNPYCIKCGNCSIVRKGEPTFVEPKVC